MSRDCDMFADALALPASERPAFLDRACAGDHALQSRITTLLAAHTEAHLFFDAPLMQPRTLPEEKRGDVIDRYKLLQKIGEGGCGVVWMAEQEEPVRRRVALKVIKLGMDTKAVVARFEAERQALAMMDHSNIAKVLDGGATDTGRPYFVMELVRGIPITQFCDNQNLPTRERLKLFIKVCHAIQHAHQKGIIHRDIKPSNVLVTLRDNEAVPMVIDFGIAKATQGRLTDQTLLTGFEQFLGTPTYMSPEQAEFNLLDVDTRSDIYSLGVLLYELLTGHPPFDPKTLREAGIDRIRQIVREVEPPRPSVRLGTLTDEEKTTIAQRRNTAPAQLALLLRGDLDWIVMRCIEKLRTRRYATTSGLENDIQCYLDNQPVAARPPSPTYILHKLLKRHRVAFGAAAIVGATLVLGTTVSTWAFWKEKAARERAVSAELEQGRQRENALAAQASETQLRRTAERNELAARHRAYAADINLVQQALAVDNLGRAQNFLNRQRPEPGQPDLRGWEWRYLWQFCRSDAQSVICENRGRIGSLAASANGRWLAAAGTKKGKLSVFDLETDEEIIVPAGDDYVWAAISPTEPIIAVSATRGGGTARPSYRVFLWNLATREQIRELPIREFCGRLVFSSDGKNLMTAARELGVWRVSDGKQISSASLPLNASRATATIPVAVTPDLGIAAHVVQARQIRVIDLPTGKAKWQEPATTDNVITALAFSPDHTLLASSAGYQDSTIRLWEVASGREIGRLEGHRTYVKDLLFWPDGKTLASAGADQTIRLWDVESRRLRRTLRGHKSEVSALALLSHGRTLASGSRDGSVFLWDTALSERQYGHLVLPKPTLAWHVNNDNATIITVDAAGAVDEWSGESLQTRTTLTDVGICGDAFFSKDGSTIVTTSAAALVRMWDWRWQRAASEWTRRSLRPIALLTGGQKLIAVGGPPFWSNLGEWIVATGEPTRSWDVPFFQGDTGLAASPDERWIVAGSLNSGFVIVDLEIGAISARSELGCRGPAFSADSRLLAIPSPDDGRTRIWDVSTGREIAQVEGFLQGAHSAAFSPDGRRLAVTSSGREAIKIWDMASLETLITLEANGSTSRTNTAFSANGDILGAYYGNQILNLWRAPSWAEIDADERRSAQHRIKTRTLPLLAP